MLVLKINSFDLSHIEVLQRNHEKVRKPNPSVLSIFSLLFEWTDAIVYIFQSVFYHI